MDRSVLENLVCEIKGASFASIDSETVPTPGYLKITTGQRVLLFATHGGSGYEAMVKRRLIEAGKNPDNFSVGDLPWGRRVNNLPLIEHKGKTYLQVIELSEGESKYFNTVTWNETDPDDLNLPSKRTNQGLSATDEVRVRCYNIEHLTRVVLMGEQLVAEAPKRAILRLNV